MIFSTAYADTAPQSGGLASLLLPISLIVVFYFLLIRPQQKQRKQHQTLIASLKKGDKVMTNSGLIATITKVVNDQEVLLEIANGVHCKFVKSAIINVINAESQTQASQPQATQAIQASQDSQAPQQTPQTSQEQHAQVSQASQVPQQEDIKKDN